MPHRSGCNVKSGIGTPTFLNRSAGPDKRRWQASDTVNYVRGNQNLRFDGDYLHTNDLSENLLSIFGSCPYSGNNYAPLASYFTS